MLTTLLADRYELGSVLGAGGMGEVRDGRDVRLDRPVAIKLMRRDLAQQAKARRAFEREAQAAARLIDPCVVAVFDTGEEEGVPFIVMERLPGRTLADEMARGPLDAAKVRRLALQVLAGLQAAHDTGIVHRDLKPSNILLTDVGDAKVADFGIARSVEDDQTTGVVLGTAMYVAPERIAGAPATAASDLYSLGVVLYEAVSGAKPFVADAPVAVLHAVCEGAAPPLDDDIDPQLRETIERAMARDPADRFASAREMAASLGAGASESTAPITSPESTARLPTAALPIPHRLPPPDHRRRTTRPSPPRWRTSLAAGIAAVVAAGALAVVLASGSSDANPGGRAPSTSTPATRASANATQPPLPAPLELAFRDLDRAIRR